ncbi:hypothetical protein AVEN_265295-1 [Araneus ventricosus]|uniref:Tesmin/TSO1-like CXC domain-containing protein n=1 Tax=Araneus ventricosus TaxID=182803 RepID=A0A4Y2EIC7_ARAVE|nr:hypothetical protein AVEN_265295-1 [Araneus ventricosus]
MQHNFRVLWKGQSVQLFNRNKYLQDIPDIFSNPKSSYTYIKRTGEKFIITLYSNTKKEENSLNKMRYDCFNQLVGQVNFPILLSKVPPTTEATHQHCRRTFHQVKTWQGECLNPSNLGWKLVNKSLTSIYTTKGPAEAKVVSLITCGCNKGSGKKYKCVRANLRCTTLCKNCRGQS